MAAATNTRDDDVEVLARLNADYVAADQNGDVERYRQLLADDFLSSLPDFKLRDKKQFLDLMSKPRPFTELRADDVRIRVLGDFAIVHAHFTFRTDDGVRHEGRYTDDYQRRNGKWLCVSANVMAMDLSDAVPA